MLVFDTTQTNDLERNLLMTGVSDNKSDVVLFGELQGGSDIGILLDVNSVADIVTKRAGLRSIGEGVATLVGKIRLHN